MDAGVCGAVASWTAPTVNDNCPGATITQTAGPSSGSLFPAGVDDGDLHRDGRSRVDSDLQFHGDGQPGCASANDRRVPGEHRAGGDGRGRVRTVASWTAPTVNDDCPGATIAQTARPSSGSLFPAGVTTVTYTATDAAGLTATCRFTVTVSPDAQAPTIAGCPANIGPVAMDAGVCGAVASWTAPTVNDNCPGATIAQTAGPSSESFSRRDDDGDLHRDGRSRVDSDLQFHGDGQPGCASANDRRVPGEHRAGGDGRGRVRSGGELDSADGQ